VIIETLQKYIQEALKALNIESHQITLEHPGELSHGDFATNIALALCKKVGMKPRELAEKIVAKLSEKLLPEIAKIEIAGPGFINFHLSKDFLVGEIAHIFSQKEKKPKVSQKVMVEYTQPNPFKEFHIGHLMNNAIGEAVSRILETTGSAVKRATYHGDVGMHVAKTIWALQKTGESHLTLQTMGKAYAEGNTAFETDPSAKAEIMVLNKKIYERTDAKVNALYDAGRKASLDGFEKIYKRLGSTFDFHFFESESAPAGKQIVIEQLEHGIFEKSEGAVVFKGEAHDLHTRVFLNKEGLPTYEAKDIGLLALKEKAYPHELSITITANEQSEYFKVIRCVSELIYPEMAGKIKHLSHGMLRLPSGKMSSRTGTIISADSLLSEAKELALKKLAEREMAESEKEQVAEQVAIGAIKYAILRQAVGGDIIFDFEKSLSFEGDSGPYLQYTTVRARTVLAKAKSAGLVPDVTVVPKTVGELERTLYRFPEVLAKASLEYAPHLLVTFAIELSASFNAYYGNNLIIDEKNPESPYRLALTSAVAMTLEQILHLLAIPVPERM
jgi:arginyl-tRNA synthetase